MTRVRPRAGFARPQNSARARVRAQAVQPVPYRYAGGGDLALLVAGRGHGQRLAVGRRPAELDPGPGRRVAGDHLSLLEDAAGPREVGDLLGNELHLARV